MRFKFESDLDFQLQAVDAVCDLFRGQEVSSTEFTVNLKLETPQFHLAFANNILGVGNQMVLSDDELEANLNEIQIRNGLPPSGSIVSSDFTVEMETGTGKTYVYLRTIFELNKRYGFTKFVIVVPSVAIKEGVYKSLQMTCDHFKSLYSGTPFEYFLYDSTRLGQVRSFVSSSQIQIMVITVGAINKKDVNNLYKDNEKTGGGKPIDLIRATRPILIVDEPQSVDGGLGGRGKEALGAMSPLCTLRYSATHTHHHHMLYRLDAVDAYERKLVKQIEVASATTEDAHNKPYVRLISTANNRGNITARVELDIALAGVINRQERIVQYGFDLEQETGREVYRNCRIGEIRVGKGRAYVELHIPGGECYLREGESWGDVDTDAIQRQMIRRTIREHLDKEKRLHPHGIKVLTLFFVDSVEHYRQYDKDGSPLKGDFARMFEEQYKLVSRLPDYRSLFRGVDIDKSVEEVHDGYFSIDRKGGWTNTAENNQINRENAERAYNLIMKEKEKLLKFDEPLKFIFSHSALREGWDNPNVFQICTLRDIRSERERRQTIGRGLRLCVNQQGKRMHGFEFNTLTVIATENYEKFAENLQQEIEEDTGIRFGFVEAHQFASIPIVGEDGKPRAMGFENSRMVFQYLKTKGYVDTRGRIQDSLRELLKNDSFAVPHEFVAQQAEITSLLSKLAGRLKIKNADDRRTVRPRETVLASSEFRELWDRIKYKTTYRVAFDNERLLNKCVAEMRSIPPIPRTRLQWRKADIEIGQSGVRANETSESATVVLGVSELEMPDLLSELQERTQLTRRSISRILIASRRLNDFKLNPQKFIEIAAHTLNRCKREALVDGIQYRRIGDDSYYAQELFVQKEFTGYLKNMLDAKKSVYDKVLYEAKTEAHFAEQLEKNTAVELYAKLPSWFTVPTPLGSYNPDWAVLIDSEEGERLYFVVETKGSTLVEDLRHNEAAKIECGRAHFNALQGSDGAVRYEVASSLNQLLASVD